MDCFSFPYEPYAIQTALMEAIQQCIDERKVGILESPTGTGKSLSIICSTLSWLANYEESEPKRLRELIVDAEKAGEDAKDWVLAREAQFKALESVGKESKELDTFKEISEKLEQIRLGRNARKSVCRKKRERHEIDAEVETSSESYLSITTEEVDECAPELFAADAERMVGESDEPFQSADSKLSCTKIFYASRTHSQLEQFAAEIMKTSFKPRIITIGSREKLCVNSSVKVLKHVSLMNSRCSELREAKNTNKAYRNGKNEMIKIKACESSCPFYKASAVEELSMDILCCESSATSNLVEYGRKHSACPYYAVRRALPLCQLVLLPYQILFQKSSREAWGIDIANNVVLIDEAHNILQSIANAHSVILTADAIAESLSLLEQYRSTYVSRFNERSTLCLGELIELTSAFKRVLTKFMSRSEDTVLPLVKFFVELNSSSINFFEILRYIDKTHLCRKLNGFFLRRKYSSKLQSTQEFRGTGIQRMLQKRLAKNAPSKNEKMQARDAAPTINTSSTCPIYSLKAFIDCLTTNTSDASIILQQPDRIKFVLLNSASKLKDLVNAARSTIFIGGTMEPSEFLRYSLTKLCNVESSRIFTYSCEHIIDDKQLAVVTFEKDLLGNELRFTYDNRDRLLTSITSIFSQLARIVPNGLIAFFPSYEYVKKFQNTLMKSTEFSEIRQYKDIMFESKGTSVVWNEYVKRASSVRGAILCAVVNGKLSEGINFSDELGRCVVMIGLPFGNKNDVEFREKLKYVERTMGSKASAAHYEADCMHAVNQGIGRVIRHRNDYATIVLLDSRFSTTTIRKNLSAWIRSRVTVCSDLNKATEKITQFFHKY